MLRNKQQREAYIAKRETVFTSEAHAIALRRIQINKDLFFNELCVYKKFQYPAAHEAFEAVRYYCSGADGIMVSGPTSEASAVAYLKDHRDDPFVKELKV